MVQKVAPTGGNLQQKGNRMPYCSLYPMGEEGEELIQVPVIRLFRVKFLRKPASPLRRFPEFWGGAGSCFMEKVVIIG
ncbi:hypothetical protein TNCV_3478351 [Trichonephila clavipes]|nr:hypothetical protein TNCV_3478351 [Trichonephila clavipes]